MFASKTVNVKPVAGCKRAVPVQAQKADRRALLGSIVAGVASVASVGSALADVTPVDLFDDRKAKKTGFDIIYEARDLDLPQNVRDGITQFKGDVTATKARFTEASRRLTSAVPGYIEKEYWTEAIEELRRQMGTFRQDLGTLSSAKTSKAERKAGASKARDLIQACEDLDQAFRKKDQDKAKKLYAVVKTKLSDFQSTVVA